MNLTNSVKQRRLTRLLALLVLPGVSACSSLLDVSNPGSVQAGDLENPALAQTIVVSTTGRFECAYVNHLLGITMMSNELIDISNFANVHPWATRSETLRQEAALGGCPDSRTSTALGAYSVLQQARYLAEDGIRLITSFPDNAVPTKTLMLGTLEAYAGYSTLLLGEAYCEMAFDGGPLQTRQQVFQRAEERFTAAITRAQAANNTNLRLMATLGRARTRLNLGNLAGAATDADQITANFVWNAEYATVTATRENRFYHVNNLNRAIGINPSYGTLLLGGVRDKRVPVTNTGQPGQSGSDPWWTQQKYNSAAAPIPLASWAEAQLIIAEARPAEATAAINRLRAAQSLPAYVPSAAGVLADVLEERKRQLFLEGHRFNDMIRHNLPFPTGINHQGDPWGPVKCLPLPDQERRNNPNIGA